MGTKSTSNLNKGRKSGSVLIGVLFVAASMIAAMAIFVMTTAAITLTQTAEATSLLDLCKTYEIFCSDPEPEPEPSPTGEKEITLFYWHSAKSEEALNKLKSIVEGTVRGNTNILIFHYCEGCSPTKAQIDTLKATSGFTNAQKGMQGSDLPGLRDLAPIVKQHFGTNAWLGYGIEGRCEDNREVCDPVASVREAKSIANQYDLRLLVTPGYGITKNDQQASAIVKQADLYNMQTQRFQDDSAGCTELKNNALERVQVLEAAKPTIEGKITYQLSLTSPAASGKTTRETLIDCMDVVSPTDVDGVTVWYGGADLGDGDYKAAYAHHENNFPNR